MPPAPSFTVPRHYHERPRAWKAFQSEKASFPPCPPGLPLTPRARPRTENERLPTEIGWVRRPTVMKTSERLKFTRMLMEAAGEGRGLPDPFLSAV